MFFFQLIRIKNLLILAFSLYLLQYHHINDLDIFYALNTTFFIIYLISILGIMAAGNIINDLIDIKADQINKPNKQYIGKKISVKNAKKWYFFLNFIGLLSGTYLCFKINKPEFTLIYILVIFSLFWYSKKLQYKTAIGNILISLLVSLPILLLGWLNFSKNYYLSVFFAVIFLYAIFAFLLTLIREIIKDIQDYKGDTLAGLKTLPIQLGSLKTIKIIKILVLITLAILISIAIYSYTYQPSLSIYLSVVIGVPLFYTYLKIQPKNISKMSTLLKIIMFLGVLSILIP